MSQTQSSPEFGITLRNCRHTAGLSQKQVAETIGVAPSTYNKWESGETPYRVDMLLPLSRALHIGVAELLPCGLVVTIGQADGSGNSLTLDARKLYEELLGAERHTNLMLQTRLQQVLDEVANLRN